MQQHASKHFNPDFLSDPWGQNSTCSEHGHVAYKIKVNHRCSNMVANILHAYLPPGDGVKWSKILLSEYGHVAY